MEEAIKEEIQRLNDLLVEYGISDKRRKLLEPVIENTAFMKVKLEEARKMVKETSVVIQYDNGGGQKGLRENPIFKGYEALWKSYMSGMNVIMQSMPQEVVRVEADKIVEAKTMLDMVREKHKKQYDRIARTTN